MDNNNIMIPFGEIIRNDSLVLYETNILYHICIQIREWLQIFVNDARTSGPEGTSDIRDQISNTKVFMKSQFNRTHYKALYPKQMKTECELLIIF